MVGLGPCRGVGRRGRATALVVTWCVAMTAGAAQAAPVVVTVVAGVKASGEGVVAGVEAGDQSTTFMLSGRLPSSEEFDLVLPVPGSAAVAAEVRLWPEAELSCTDGQHDLARASTVHQYHVRGMRLSGSGLDRKLTATLPPLEVDQRFCIFIDHRVELGEAEAQRLVKSLMSDDLEAIILAGTKLSDEDLRQLVVQVSSSKAWETDSGKRVPPNSRTDIGERALRVFKESERLYKLKAALNERREREGDKSRKLKTATTSTALIHDQLRQAFSGPRSNLPKTSLLWADRSFWAPNEFIGRVEKVIGSTLKEQLEAELRRFDKSEWADFLGGAPDDPEKYTKYVAQRKPAENLRLPESWLVLCQRKMVEAATLPPDKFCAPEDYSRLAAQLSTPELRGLEHLKDSVKRLGMVHDAWIKARAASEQADEAVKVAGQAAVDAFHQALYNEIRKTDVRIVGTIEQLVASSPTPNAGNYAWFELGVGIAPVHTRAGVESFWVLPYSGLNLSFAPVDRVVPLSQLVGGWTQRVSVTLGLALTGPALTAVGGEPAAGLFGPGPVVPRRKIAPAFGSIYPVVAVGYRPTHFTRVSLGVVLYTEIDGNPAVDESVLRVTPFVGYSIDLDLLEVLKNGVARL